MAGRSVAVLMAWTLTPRIGNPFRALMFDLIFQCYVVKSQRKKNYFAMAMKNTDKLYQVFHL